jgi:hypothetical protein
MAYKFIAHVGAVADAIPVDVGGTVRDRVRGAMGPSVNGTVGAMAIGAAVAATTTTTTATLLLEVMDIIGVGAMVLLESWVLWME